MMEKLEILVRDGQLEARIVQLAVRNGQLVMRNG